MNCKAQDDDYLALPTDTSPVLVPPKDPPAIKLTLKSYSRVIVYTEPEILKTQFICDPSHNWVAIYKSKD